jgi:hypothetical protein
MEKNILKSISVIILAFCFFTSITYVNANTANDDSFDKKSGGYITVGGEVKELYKEFKNQEKALNKFKKDYNKELNKIQQKYKLKELSNDNWRKYRSYIEEIGKNDSIFEIRRFFDIYENKDQNVRIRQISMNNSLDEKTKRELMELPYDGEKKEIDQSGLLKIRNGNKIPNINKAISYAEKHATNPNSGLYAQYEYFKGKDCTNFVSQIMEAGGVKQEKSYSKEKGWWHEIKSGPAYTRYHINSISWVRARTLSRRLGIRHVCTSHREFSKYVYRGNIIGMDTDKDGDFDHLGFVTKTDNYEAQYGNKTFYDYKVAQHSRDYYAWASWKINSWADVEGKVRYCIIGYHGVY